MPKLRLRTRWQVFKRVIRQYLERKIQRRMVLNYLGLGVVPILIVSIVLIRLTENTVQRYIFERNLEIAKSAKKEIALFVEKPLTILATLTSTRDILEMERLPQSRLINKIKADYPIFRKLFVLDKSGIAVTTTSFGDEFTIHSSEPYFQVAMQADTFYSAVYFTPQRFPVMLVALPIKKYNTVGGVLVGEIDLQFIWQLVDSIRIGNTGNAYLIGSDGSAIAHPDREKVLNKVSYRDFPYYSEVMAGRENIEFYDEQGVPLLIAYSSIPNLNWGIIVQQPELEAFELARKMRNRVTLFVLLTTFLALILAFATIRRITKPLEILVKGVRHYAENLTHRIKIERKDELALLASELNAMAASLEKNQQQLRRMERLAALSRFASLVSHEIRNPLNAMNINIQILRRLITSTDSPPEKKMKYLNIISSEINRMNNLVSNFLAITRPPELNLIRTDIHQILEEVIITLEGQAKSLGINVRRRYWREPLHGMFDHNQIKQVFQNILLNAFEAMPNGGEMIISTERHNSGVTNRQTKSGLILKFQDNGEGIPSRKINEIFEFYYTTKKTGTGLGLAIAKQIVEGHKGKIKILSEEKAGTIVIIELPLES